MFIRHYNCNWQFQVFSLPAYLRYSACEHCVLKPKTSFIGCFKSLSHTTCWTINFLTNFTVVWLQGDGQNIDVLDPIASPTGVGHASQGTTPGQYSLDDFELIRVIGRGSYAKVLMVELKSTKRIYAMKIIKKSLVNDDEDIDWIQTEKHVFETASNFPFLVGLHSCFQSESRLFFVIEFVRGGDLMFHMQRMRKLTEDHARFYAAEISLALHFLHERGIIYRYGRNFTSYLTHERTNARITLLSRITLLITL